MTISDFTGSLTVSPFVSPYRKIINLNKNKKIFTYDDFRERNPYIRKGKNSDSYYVEVNIPTPLRSQHKGKATLRRSAGKSRQEYDLKKRGIFNTLVNEIIDAQGNEQKEKDQLAERLLSEANFKLDTHNIALMREFPNVIPKGNSCFKEYGDDPKKGRWTTYNVPKPSMPYKELVELKRNLDFVTRMVYDDEPSQEEIDSDKPHKWNNLQRLYAEAHLSPECETFWRDLLLESAQLQGEEIPQFDDMKEEDFWDRNRHKRKGLGSRSILAENPRQRLVSVPTMSTYEGVYKDHLKLTQDVKDTRRKLLLGFTEFHTLMGDPVPSNISEQMAEEYFYVQMEKFPERSQKVLGNRKWALKDFNRFCFRKGIMTSKPFNAFDTPKIGKSEQGWRPYTDTDLDKIFALDWQPQERLLISMALSTGCRLGELALLTWERIKREGNHFEYITLLDDPDIEVEATTKNDGSKRIIPLHPSLVDMLPVRKSGRIFDYSIDGDGKASTSAGRAINPIIDKLINDKRKSFHSFRSTFKIKLENSSGITEALSNIITGHTKGGKGDNTGSAQRYRGMTAQDRFDAIIKIDLPWLE